MSLLTRLILARDLAFLAAEIPERLSDQTLEVQRMLGSLILRIRNGEHA